MLIRWFKLRDLREYEESTRDSILDLFKSVKDINIDKVLSLVSLGNGKCSIEEAGDILDAYLEDHSFMEGLLEIKEQILGKESIQDEPDEDLTIETKQFDSLTALYTHYCMQLMNCGMGYSEFWGMTTLELFRVFEAIRIKDVNEINKNLELSHTLAALIGAAVWGKLPKKAPKVDLIEEGDKQDILVAQLKAMAQSLNDRNKKRRNK